MPHPQIWSRAECRHVCVEQNHLLWRRQLGSWQRNAHGCVVLGLIYRALSLASVLYPHSVSERQNVATPSFAQPTQVPGLTESAETGHTDRLCEAGLQSPDGKCVEGLCRDSVLWPSPVPGACCWPPQEHGNVRPTV